MERPLCLCVTAGLIFADFNIRGALRFTHQKIFPFHLRNCPRIEPWDVNRKVNQFSYLSTGNEPPEKIPARRNKPYCFLGQGFFQVVKAFIPGFTFASFAPLREAIGQDVINVTPAGQF